MDINLKFSLFSIAGGGLGGFIYNYLSKRYSFFKFGRTKPKNNLFLAICKAVNDEYYFIGIDDTSAENGCFPYNEWLKLYKHYPTPSRGGGLNFYNPYKEKKIYKIDCLLFYMIKIAKIFKNTTITNADCSSINAEKCNDAFKIYFYKNKNKIPQKI